MGSWDLGPPVAGTPQPLAGGCMACGPSNQEKRFLLNGVLGPDTHPAVTAPLPLRLTLHRSQAHYGHPEHHGNTQDHWASQFPWTLCKFPTDNCGPHPSSHNHGPLLHTGRDSHDHPD